MSQERKDELNELDLELEKMAQETPEMPADFHARWTEAVRAEAGQNKTEKQQDSRRQWRYVLSAAAVFVFLIGGTLLTRSMDQKDRTNKTAVIETAGIPSKEPGPDTDGEEDLFMAVNEAAEEAERDMSEPMAAAAGSNETMAAMGAKAAETAMKADMAVNEAMDMEMEEAAEEAEAPAEDAGAETAAEEPEAEAAGAEQEETEEPAQESEFVSFLKDLGSFTLKTLAVAAAAAALAFGAAAIHKALKKRGQKKG